MFPFHTMSVAYGLDSGLSGRTVSLLSKAGKARPLPSIAKFCCFECVMSERYMKELIQGLQEDEDGSL